MHTAPSILHTCASAMPAALFAASCATSSVCFLDAHSEAKEHPNALLRAVSKNILVRTLSRYLSMAGKELQYLAATRRLTALALVSFMTFCLYPVVSPLAHTRIQTQDPSITLFDSYEPQANRTQTPPAISAENVDAGANTSTTETATTTKANASVEPSDAATITQKQHTSVATSTEQSSPVAATKVVSFSDQPGVVVMPISQRVAAIIPSNANKSNISPFVRRSGAWQVIMPISSQRLDVETHVSAVRNDTSPEAPYEGLLTFLPNGDPALRTANGYVAMQTVQNVQVKNPETPRAFESIAAVTSGSQRVEELLLQVDADLYLLQPVSEQFSLTEYMGNGYDPSKVFQTLPSEKTAVRSYAECRLDRVEMAQWLSESREKSLAAGAYFPQNGMQYRDYVERFSRHYALPPSLIYAIMRTESSFNPTAISSANALGLMQVVPQTAGGEVYAYLNGQSGIPRAETLFSPESNIRYGATYLHLLNEKHFKNVQNYVSRELCIIAAYNGGPGAVLRVFDRNNREKAVDVINSLSPEQLYAKLRSSLPSQETRDYIVKVTTARNQYRQIFDF